MIDGFNRLQLITEMAFLLFPFLLARQSYTQSLMMRKCSVLTLGEGESPRKADRQTVVRYRLNVKLTVHRGSETGGWQTTARRPHPARLSF